MLGGAVGMQGDAGCAGGCRGMQGDAVGSSQQQPSQQKEAGRRNDVKS